MRSASEESCATPTAVCTCRISRATMELEDTMTFFSPASHLVALQALASNSSPAHTVPSMRLWEKHCTACAISSTRAVPMVKYTTRCGVRPGCCGCPDEEGGRGKEGKESKEGDGFRWIINATIKVALLGDDHFLTDGGRQLTNYPNVNHLCLESSHGKGAADSKKFLSSQHEELKYLTRDTMSKAFARAIRPALVCGVALKQNARYPRVKKSRLAGSSSSLGKLKRPEKKCNPKNCNSYRGITLS